MLKRIYETITNVKESNKTKVESLLKENEILNKRIERLTKTNELYQELLESYKSYIKDSNKLNNEVVLESTIGIENMVDIATEYDQKLNDDEFMAMYNNAFIEALDDKVV